MKKLHLIPIVLLIIILSCSMFVSLSWGKNKPVVLRFGMALNPKTPQAIEFKIMAERFNKRVGPDYKLEFYDSQTLVPFPESLDAVRTGAAEMMGWPPGAFSQDAPGFGISELIFSLNSPEGGIQAAKQFVPVLSGILEKNFNQKVLCGFSPGSNELLAKKPIRTLNDLKGLLVQAPSPQMSGLVKALGGSPVAIPFPEAYSSLEKGVVDAIILAPNGLYSFRLYEVARYLITAYMCPAITVVSINLDVWNKMPKKVQTVLLEEMEGSADLLNQQLADTYWADIDRLKGVGVDVYQLPAEERAKWKQAAQPYIDKLVAKMGDIGQMGLRITDDINKQCPYPR